jgi:hypothetical protein
VAVFVGRHGVGRWQQQQIDLAIAENTKRGMPVIPVGLADALKDMEMPHFLENFTWVNFRDTRLDPFERLVKGIPSQTKTPPVPQPDKTGLKPGAPYPRLRLPDNYVDRPQAITAVKSLLLAENSTVVVSAIAGLGGLGKSVLATALVLNEGLRSPGHRLSCSIQPPHSLRFHLQFALTLAAMFRPGKNPSGFQFAHIARQGFDRS